MSILRIVATPIGNLEDITLRALRVLKESDFILCEDTRTSSKLLNNYEIKTKTISFHQHSKDTKVDKIIELLNSDNNLSLITDAGTPGISDPGSKLVEIIREKQKSGEIKDVLIESVPGVSAITTAISIAGTGFDHFLFLGFLPHKKGRQTKIKEIFETNYSVVLYESKHRILKLLSELKELQNNYRLKLNVSLARELTKMHESFYNGTVEELISKLENDKQNTKGEFVVLIKKDKKKNIKE
ncbi:MAG: 16S rRNA (cytidine(1402)-2'-O)-methyltransferase [Patescibacteria group bacterium]|jgi:16S rRNA (cytidine1402-2'-O)-methyltransferase|nr:16S rRNA (cytidine(1402)-2'-O)-methyltransferase [Patescibacteria group bacterium]